MEVNESETDSHSFSSQERDDESYQSLEHKEIRRVRFQEPQSESSSSEEEEEEENSSEWEEEELQPRLQPQHGHGHSDSDTDSDTKFKPPRPGSFNRNPNVLRRVASDIPRTSGRAPLLPPNPPPVNRLSWPYPSPHTPIAPNERAIDVEGLPPYHFSSNGNAPPTQYKPQYQHQPRYRAPPDDPRNKNNRNVDFVLLPLSVPPYAPPSTLNAPPKKGERNSSSAVPGGFGPPGGNNLINTFRFVEDEDEDELDRGGARLGKGDDGGGGAKKKKWVELGKRIGMGVAKTVGLLYLLFMFVCSLDLLSLGFRLIGGRGAGEMFRKSDLLQNPVVGVMMGILTTLLVQSSSTSTSIIVGMVSAGFLEVPVAIPLIMGANIGTSITNTIVSFSQAGNRAQFRRAFAGATLLDMFNWITVIVLLTVEVLTGYLYHLSTAIMKGLMPDKQSGGDFQLLSRLTRPFVNLIVQLDRSVLDCWSTPNCTHADNSSLIREYCKVVRVQAQVISTGQMEGGDGGGGAPMEYTAIMNNTRKCDFLFAGTPLNDAAAGGIILTVALIVLCTCLVLIVKLLNSVLQGQVAVVIQKTINADIPYVPWLTGYLAILVGAVMTFLVQSSSVFTSALTPLIGLEVISVERAYPLTLGSNIGTTTTALLASMAVEGKALFPSMQIALCHLLFNVTGILLFYPIPLLRFPIPLAKFLGKTTSKYRWFAIVYMVAMFVLLPAVTIGLSAFGGRIPVIIFCCLLGFLALFVGIVTGLQRRRAEWLPEKMRTWKWLPAPLRSLQPYDDFFTKFTYCRKLRSKTAAGAGGENGGGDSGNNEEKPPPPQSPPYYPTNPQSRSNENNNVGGREEKDGDGDVQFRPSRNAKTNSFYEHEV